MVDTDFVLYVGLAAAWVGGWATTVLGLLDEAAAGGTFKLCDGQVPILSRMLVLLMKSTYLGAGSHDWSLSS